MNPLAGALKVSGLMEEFRLGKDARQHKLRNRPIKNSVRVGQDHRRRAEFVKQNRVDARRGNVHPPQPVLMLPGRRERRIEEVPHKQRVSAWQRLGQVIRIHDTDLHPIPQCGHLRRGILARSRKNHEDGQSGSHRLHARNPRGGLSTIHNGVHHGAVSSDHGSALPEHPALSDQVEGQVTAPPNPLGLPAIAPIGGVGIGIVAPYDFALDRELWRWAPEDVALLTTRTPYAALPVSVDQALAVGDTDVVASCTTSLIATQPRVVTYMCTSGSFVHGRAGESALVDAMLGSGAPAAMTTSGAMVMAMNHLGIKRVAVATPYDTEITQLLVDFLAESGIGVAASAHLGLHGLIWRIPYAATVELVRQAVDQSAGCDAVFISCTNVPTYDLIAPLERELGIPVLTANQVTIWAALQLAGVATVGTGQSLITRTAEDAA